MKSSISGKKIVLEHLGKFDYCEKSIFDEQEIPQSAIDSLLESGDIETFHYEGEICYRLSFKKEKEQQEETGK